MEDKYICTHIYVYISTKCQKSQLLKKFSSNNVKIKLSNFKSNIQILINYNHQLNNRYKFIRKLQQ